VHVAATDDNGPGRMVVPLGQPVQEDGVTYHFFPRQTRFYTASWPLARWLGQEVASFDVVHIHALFSFASIAAAAVARRRAVPYVVRPLGTLNRWGMANRRPLLKQISFALFERRILAGAAAVHFTSEQEVHEAADLGVPLKAAVIPNPIAIDADLLGAAKGGLLARYPALVGRTVILFLSRIDPKKGLDLLLPAFAQAHARRPDLSLVIAGDGDPAYVAELRAEAARLGIGSQVVWAGFLAGNAKLAALADADLFALPSYSENFGNAVVEAMACGLPVLISDGVGIHREVQAANAGVVVPCNANAIATALLLLADDPARRRAMGVRGHAFVQDRFSPASVARQFVALYTTLAESLTYRTFHK
jgi:glycosyltransferase involved in cell wall biosynthesis